MQIAIVDGPGCVRNDQSIGTFPLITPVEESYRLHRQRASRFARHGILSSSPVRPSFPNLRPLLCSRVPMRHESSPLFI
jgi:hypothetical protein